MSVRAYKVIEIAKNETFNLWHDRFFMKLFEEVKGFDELNENGGSFEIAEEHLTQMKELFDKYKSEFDEEAQKNTLEIFDKVKEDFEGGYATYIAY